MAYILTMKTKGEYYTPAEVLLRIKKARKECKMSQQQMADAMDVDVTTYGKWERGKRQLGVRELLQIATILNKDVSYFTGSPFFRNMPEIVAFLQSEEKQELAQKINEIITEWDDKAQDDLLTWCSGYDKGLKRGRGL
jgi:transcriptional regulator with XRE-family HTH domain